MLSPSYMSIKAKLTAVAIATASSVFPFSVPSQADENGYLDELPSQADKNRYLDELDKLAKQQGVKHYLDKLSVSEKLKYGNTYCEVLEYKSIEHIYNLFQQKINYYVFLQKVSSEQKIDDKITFELVQIDASVKELCPAYKFKFDNFLSQYSGD